MKFNAGDQLLILVLLPVSVIMLIVGVVTALQPVFRRKEKFPTTPDLVAFVEDYSEIDVAATVAFHAFVSQEKHGL